MKRSVDWFPYLFIKTALSQSFIASGPIIYQCCYYTQSKDLMRTKSFIVYNSKGYPVDCKQNNVACTDLCYTYLCI